eukprot:7330-Heterococcus_DN1.PRE.1
MHNTDTVATISCSWLHYPYRTRPCATVTVVLKREAFNKCANTSVLTWHTTLPPSHACVAALSTHMACPACLYSTRQACSVCAFNAVERIRL